MSSATIKKNNAFFTSYDMRTKGVKLNNMMKLNVLHNFILLKSTLWGVSGVNCFAQMVNSNVMVDDILINSIFSKGKFIRI